MRLRSGRVIGNESHVTTSTITVTNTVIHTTTTYPTADTDPVPDQTQQPKRKCNHYGCTLWNNDVCCICDDKRPLQKYGYIAYTNPNLDDYTYVTRQHYYCEGCKAYIRFARHHQ